MNEEEIPIWFLKLKHIITEQDCDFVVIAEPRAERKVYYSCSNDMWALGALEQYRDTLKEHWKSQDE